MIDFYDFFYSTKKLFLKNTLYILSFLCVKIYITIVFILNFFIWVIVFFINSYESEGLIILHYNIGFGVDLVGNSSDLFVVPFLGLFVIIINIFLVFIFLRDKNFKFIVHFLLAATIIVNLFLLTALNLIYLINFK